MGNALVAVCPLRKGLLPYVAKIVKDFKLAKFLWENMMKAKWVCLVGA